MTPEAQAKLQADLNQAFAALQVPAEKAQQAMLDALAVLGREGERILLALNDDLRATLPGLFDADGNLRPDWRESLTKSSDSDQ